MFLRTAGGRDVKNTDQAVRQALPRRPSRPKNLDWPDGVHRGCLEPGSKRPPFQAGCRRCSDVTKPRFSVGVSNRLIEGVLTHRAFSGLAALCHGGRWGCQAGRHRAGGKTCLCETHHWWSVTSFRPKNLGAKILKENRLWRLSASPWMVWVLAASVRWLRYAWQQLQDCIGNINGSFSISHGAVAGVSVVGLLSQLFQLDQCTCHTLASRVSVVGFIPLLHPFVAVHATAIYAVMVACHQKRRETVHLCQLSLQVDQVCLSIYWRSLAE